MSLFKQGRYSGFIRPISYVADLMVINGFALFYFFKEVPSVNFVLLISFGWTITALASQFYEVYRFSYSTRVFNLLVIQTLLFTLLMFGFGYALVPLYDVFCQLTGINGKTQGDKKLIKPAPNAISNSII